MRRECEVAYAECSSAAKCCKMRNFSATLVSFRTMTILSCGRDERT
jgi:hypothetical protein